MSFRKVILTFIFIFMASLFVGQSFLNKAKTIGKVIISSTILNKNIYKTKAPPSSALTCTVAYKDSYYLHGATVEEARKGITYSVTTLGNGQDFVRYKELKVEGTLAYIRFLKGCRFSTTTTTVASTPTIPISITTGTTVSLTSTSTAISSTSTPAGAPGATVTTTLTANTIIKATPDDVNDYVFVISINNIDPSKRYLSSSSIIGKIVTLPVKARQKYFDGNTLEFQSNINLNYCFGWKFKIGDHPYHSHYFSVIPYACGVGAQNHIAITEGEFDEKGKVKTTTLGAQVAFTYFSAGLTYEYDRFNIGIFVGWDAMLKPYDSWAYNKKAWYGLGIGYDLFKEK